jgi:hypothetical protein
MRPKALLAQARGWFQQMPKRVMAHNAGNPSSTTAAQLACALPLEQLSFRPV